ncbi:hypothetical protein [Actibacterium sp. 188UL27-1]|uniref:hypothetical protein n=1 Tax=Actibacterium sp. 188UL27-1 TaxID=2786961 RepID=UPI00195B38B0|nr:hypothetical protein [Actibacterium sp. 188UL27-1]MBM7069772.1 hypothetical protein [Actibacterium sp. 188UL27-1]
MVLSTVGAAAFLALVNPAVAAADGIDGTVTFQGGATIPKGQIEIYLSDPAQQDNAPHGADRLMVRSNGKSTTLAFTLPSPADSPTSSALQVVARLERTDGWLLAYGSTKLRPGQPAIVMLNKALY